MPRAKDARADEALALYRQGFKLVDIAKRLEIPAGTVRRWKHSYGWEKSERSQKSKANIRKRGGQPGNRNRAAPKGNKRAEKYGLYSKYLPEETLELFNLSIGADPLDLLWVQIQVAHAAIIRAQKIAYVKDQEDKTVEVTMESMADGGTTTAFDIQQAWDKQAAFLKSQAIAQSSLRGLIKQYDDMLKERGERATEEQQLRLELLRVKLGQGAEAAKKVTIINDTRDPDQ